MSVVANKYTAFRFVSDTHKECSLCEKIKPLKDFHKDTRNEKKEYYNRHKGRSFYCKDCANKKSREWHQKNKNKPDVKRKNRQRWIKKAHGISLKEYEEKLKKQDYKCSICKTTLKLEGWGTHLDHCHKTNKLRAFLCTNCNRGLGHFKDCTEFLENAINYLKYYYEVHNDL